MIDVETRLKELFDDVCTLTLLFSECDAVNDSDFSNRKALSIKLLRFYSRATADFKKLAKTSTVKSDFEDLEAVRSHTNILSLL